MKMTKKIVVIAVLALTGTVFAASKAFSVVQPVTHYKTQACMSPGTNYEVGSLCGPVDPNGPCDRQSACVSN